MKSAGASMIAFGIVSMALSFVVLSILDCNAFLIILAGAEIRGGGRKGLIWGIVFSVLAFALAVAAVTSAGVNGIAEVGVAPVVVSSVLGIWALANWVVLVRLRALRHTPDGDEPLQDEVNSPPLFQFSLRWMFVLAVVVAIACGFGARPLPPTSMATSTWFQSTSGASGLTVITWQACVLRNRSGAPTMGYIWRKEGSSSFDHPEPIERAGMGLKVSGRDIGPRDEFQLFVNDLKGNPVCLPLSREEAANLFTKTMHTDRIEKFWHEVAVPRLKAETEPKTSPSPPSQ